MDLEKVTLFPTNYDGLRNEETRTGVREVESSIFVAFSDFHVIQ